MIARDYKQRVKDALAGYYDKLDASESFHEEQLEKRRHDLNQKDKRRKGKTRKCPTEYEEHSRIATLLRKLQPSVRFLHPNNNARNAVAARRANQLGMVAGAADIIIFTTPPARPDRKGVCLEVKAKDGRPSKVQVEWLIGMYQEGYSCFVVWGFEAAQVVLEKLGYIINKKGHADGSNIGEGAGLFPGESRRDCRFAEVQEALGPSRYDAG